MAADGLGQPVAPNRANHDRAERDAVSARQKVFVSYSRADIKLADEIVAGLDYDGGFEVFLDRHSIHEGEAWRDRLLGLIASADAVVFLLSKSSAGSDMCRWEVDQAKTLSKRIVPALIEEVPPGSAPPQLAALQYVRFDTGSFMIGLAGLREALRADLAWVREHTRLLTRAQEWEAAGKSPNRLLSGADIVAAKLWLDQRPQDAPAPLELHRDFIAASEQAEVVRLGEDRKRADQLKGALSRSRLALIGACVAGVVAAGALAWALFVGAGAEDAVQQRDDYITGQNKTIAMLQAQVAALSGAAVPVVSGGASAPAASGEAEPAKPAEPSATDVTTGTTAGPPSAPKPQPTAAPAAPTTASSPPAASAEIDKAIARLEVEAEGLQRQIEDLTQSPVQQSNAPAEIALPPAPERKGLTAADYATRMEKYVDELRGRRNAILTYKPAMPKAAPDEYNPRIIQKKK